MDAAVSFPVWGTTASLHVTDARGLDAARAALDAEIAAMGEACDRFRADSELSRLNAAGGRAVRVSALLAETLAHALRVAEATGGAVDPTVGAALVAAGYDRDLAEVRRGGPVPRLVPRPVAGWRTVRLDGRTVRLPRGVRLDLGATAKALAADRAASRAARDAGCGVLVALGGDLATGGPAPEGGWRIRVTDDHRDECRDHDGADRHPRGGRHQDRCDRRRDGDRPDRHGGRDEARPCGPRHDDDRHHGLRAGGRDGAGPGGTVQIAQEVAITGGGLATSSVTVRSWRRGGHRLHHIIDPATGLPAASCWRTASVAAASCVDANAAATAALVRGRGADAWLADLGLPARLVRLDGRPVLVAGWPADEPVPAAGGPEIPAAAASGGGR